MHLYHMYDLIKVARTEGEIESALEPLIAAAPLRERLRALRMRVLYRSGRQAEALRAFDETRQLLVEELGVEPGRELQLLHRRMLEQDPALDIRVGSTTIPAATEPVRLSGPAPRRRSSWCLPTESVWSIAAPRV